MNKTKKQTLWTTSQVKSIVPRCSATTYGESGSCAMKPYILKQDGQYVRRRDGSLVLLCKLHAHKREYTEVRFEGKSPVEFVEIEKVE